MDRPEASLAGEGEPQHPVLWEDGERRFRKSSRAPAGSENSVCIMVSLKPGLPHEEAAAARLAHEHALRGSLDGAWALRPLDLLREHGRVLLLLEHREGTPLHALIAARPAAEPALRIAVALARAVAQMHGQGLVHRDLKPSHMLVSADGAQAWLTGFGLATELARQPVAADPPGQLAGSLAYMAPEQTGRMNRSVDARSDLYALGVVLYQLFTGRLPFSARDPAEWLHCHVARQPPPLPPQAGLPAAIGQIVARLLAKMPEDRYQTAAGLLRDLICCVGGLAEPACLQGFVPASQDRPTQLVVPEKLYGRAAELAALEASFAAMLAGRGLRTVLLRGPTGVGKSSLVHELHRLLVPTQGWLAIGKFERLRRGQPYAPLAQALQQLVRHLLALPEAALECWRERLERALAPHGALAIGLVPELALILGPQSDVPALPPAEARGRFQHLLLRLLGAFADAVHPLVLFLDDLQWLDEATLELLDQLVRQPQRLRLLLVLACRDDDELGAGHPLAARLPVWRTPECCAAEIVLGALGEADLAQLLADATGQAARDVAPLAAAVVAKTAGNPFFARHFLRTLAARGLIAFERVQQTWRWDLDAIRAQPRTDNLAALMLDALERCPPQTRRALRTLACIGHPLPAVVLAAAHESGPDQLGADLWAARQGDLVVDAGGCHGFAHDRIQDAVLASMSEDQRCREHLRIGRALDARFGEGLDEELVFDIVDQLNRGATLIEDAAERERLALLNLRAARRAMAAAAHASAAHHLAVGEQHLPEDAWTRLHAVCFELALRQAECEFLAGRMEAARDRLGALLRRAEDGTERAAATCLLSDVYFALTQPRLSVAVCMDCLRRAGLLFDDPPGDEEARAAYARVLERVGGRAIETLAELPSMSDPAARANLEVLAKLVPNAATVGPALMAVVACRTVEICLEHGNADISCFAYVYFGGIAASYFGDAETSFSFGRLGFELVERQGFRRFEPVVRTYFANQIAPWSRPVQEGLALNRTTIDIAQRAGDRFSAAACASQLVAHLMVAGEPLPLVEREAAAGLTLALEAGFTAFAEVMRSQLALVQRLQGGRVDLAAVAHEHTFVRCFQAIHRLQACYWAGDIEGALAASEAASAVLWACPALIDLAEHAFFTALAHARASDAAAPQPRARHAEAVGRHQRQLAAWARRCPLNWDSRAMLVAAEVARIEGRDLAAIGLYEQAAAAARDSGFVQQEALALELAGHFHASRGFARLAQSCLAEAVAGYRRWGALGRLRQLEHDHPFLRGPQALGDSEQNLQAPLASLDLATVMRVLQAVASETELERLIEVVMRLGLEQAGARRTLLMLPFQGGHRVEAEARVVGDGIEVRVVPMQADAALLPLSVLQYVWRTHEDLLLRQDWREGPFAHDAYLLARPVGSVLCMPLLKQARLVGVIYLENELASGAFAPSSMPLLKLLASEAAISLENARLYLELREREQESRLIVDSIPGLVAALAPTGEVSAVNHQLVQFCGQPLQDMRHWFSNETIHPNDVAHVTQVCRRAADAGEAYVVDMRLRRFDGIYLWFQFRGTPLRDSGGAIIRWYVLLTDIDGLKRAEAELREAERMRLEERLRERERIARALHDTLLQGAQGFILMVEAAILKMRPDDPSRAMLENALPRAQAVMAEGRDRIQDLRAREADDADLASRLAATGRELAGEQGARFGVEVQGASHELHSSVADEAFLILREALINAFRHGGSGRVVLALRYEPGQLFASVSDEGAGIASEVLVHGGVPGHWGLRGMRERAERMRAVFAVRQREPQGTEISLRIPADVAYRWCPGPPIVSMGGEVVSIARAGP